MFRPTVVLAVLAAVAHVTVGQSQELVITSDNIVNQVCINDIPSALHNNKAVNKFDRVPIPDTWNSGGTGCITVEATNLNKLSWAGIIAYQDARLAPTAFRWQCMPMSELGGTSCCHSCSSASWAKYPANRLTTYGLNRHHNKNYKSKVPSRVAEYTEWFWTKKIKHDHICCKGRECGNLCKSCKITGPGNCDPDQCIYGTAIPTSPPVSDAPACNYKCDVEIKTWGPMSADKTSYIIVRSGATNDIMDRWTLTEWRSLPFLDMNTCTLFHKNQYTYDEDINQGLVDPQVSDWDGDATYENVVMFEMYSSVGGTAGYVPYIGVSKLTGALGGFPTLLCGFRETQHLTVSLRGYQMGVPVASHCKLTSYP